VKPAGITPPCSCSPNDLTAIGALHAVQEAGLAAGKDVAVAGYDGIQEAEFTTPPLTTLAQPTYDMARQTVQMLTGLIQGAPLLQKQVVFQPRLILRASTQG
jgi:LacI family transcriptional regulator